MAAKLLEKCEQAIIDACTKTGNRDFFYIAPDNDGRGFDPLYYLLCEPLSKRQARRYRIRAQLKRFGYNKDGSKIAGNKNSESNESMDNNNKQAIPPTNLPTQHTNKNNLLLLAEAAAGCSSEVTGNE